jgi:hypothetical protein
VGEDGEHAAVLVGAFGEVELIGIKFQLDLTSSPVTTPPACRLALLAQGYSNAAIAAMLVATEATVAKHIRNICEGARTRYRERQEARDAHTADRRNLESAERAAAPGRTRASKSMSGES